MYSSAVCIQAGWTAFIASETLVYNQWSLRCDSSDQMQGFMLAIKNA